MKNRPASCQLILSFGFILICGLCNSTALAEDRIIYQSDFERGTQGWVARQGMEGVVPKLAVSSENSKDTGKPYLAVQANGKLGCGFQLKEPVTVEVGKEYLLSFWMKSSNPIVISYRVTGGPGEEYGEETKKWHVATKSHDEWVKVEYGFVASSSSIGLDIVTGIDKYEPTQLAIYDIKIASQ